MEPAVFTLAISHIESSLYQWKVWAGSAHEVLDGAESSVTDCLSDAAQSLPADALIAVAYRGITLGTYRRSWLVDEPARYANDLMGTYASLVD